MTTPPRYTTAALARFAALAGLAGLAVGACVYDPDHRCGPAMIFLEVAHACVCDDHAVAVLGGCRPCAADEVVVAGKCACPAGETKGDDGVCAVVAGLGEGCDTASAPCGDRGAE
jgi:hypothetical protein